MVILALSGAIWIGIGLGAFLLLCLVVIGGDTIAEKEAYIKRLSSMTPEELDEERKRIDTWGFD